jgi:glutamate formiminotransferase/formiminotetrahydrofolate cyclodeaminase
MKLIECVPNFSEGRNPKIIAEIAQAIESVSGIKMLDIDSGAATHRTVMTFVGPLPAVEEAAFAGIARASRLIDMSHHSGAHPRMGATDVCPFVPLSGSTMEEAVLLSKRVGKRVGNELGIPVYLYEESAISEIRRSLANIRKGEYEGLSAKLADREWTPDFGPNTLNRQAGATCIGAREFLIAYNINLNTRNKRLAVKIAEALREAGRTKRDENGQQKNIPGKFKCVKAVGWYIEEYQRAQVSINFTNYKISPVHRVYEEASRIADTLGIRVTGSELVGLIPLAAMAKAGKYFLKKVSSSLAIPQSDLIRTAVQSLGLSELAPFQPAEKIIEYRVKKTGQLSQLSLANFVDEVSRDSFVPGGGSVAALLGALGGALSSMVVNLTAGKKGYGEANQQFGEFASSLQKKKDSLMAAVDEDTEAFSQVIEAARLPNTTEEERFARGQALEEANRGAAESPLSILSHIEALSTWTLAVAQNGNANSASDAGVAGACLQAGAESAWFNVLINTKNLQNQATRKKLNDLGEELVKRIRVTCRKISEVIAHRIAEGS